MVVYQAVISMDWVCIGFTCNQIGVKVEVIIAIATKSRNTV